MQRDSLVPDQEQASASLLVAAVVWGERERISVNDSSSIIVKNRTLEESVGSTIEDQSIIYEISPASARFFQGALR